MKCKACGKEMDKREMQLFYGTTVCFKCYYYPSMDTPIPFEPVWLKEAQDLLDELDRISIRNGCWSVVKTGVLKTEPVNPLVYSVDLDGTLCSSAWTCDECENATPNEEAIKKINELAERNFIVIHTARRHGLYQSTIKWLERNGVKYHAIRMEKMPSDKIVDFDSINCVEEL